MASRIKADLLLVDGALRSSPSRAQLKGGSVDAWTSCCTVLLAVHPVLCQSVLAAQIGSAPTVAMHWRKSSASKKLLALLRAVVEEAPALPCEAAEDLRCCSVHGCISVILIFWERSPQSATLWPAMREWIVELGGITSLWAVSAWVVMIPTQDNGAGVDVSYQLLRKSLPALLALTKDMTKIRRPVELAQNSAVVTVMSSVLGDLLPRDFAAGNAQLWDLGNVLLAIGALCHNLEASELSAHLHKPLLVFWPYLISEMRRQHQLCPESAGASVITSRVTSESWLCGLKVHILTGHLHSASLFMGP